MEWRHFVNLFIEQPSYFADAMVSGSGRECKV